MLFLICWSKETINMTLSKLVEMTFKSLPVKSEDERMDIHEISLNFDEDEFELVFADSSLKCCEINKITFLAKFN